MKGLLIFLLIFILYMLLFKSKCFECSENMENTNLLNNNNLSSINDVFPNISKKNNNKRIDLEKLPECSIPMKMEFSSNINNMMNNGNQIYQDIVTPTSTSGAQQSHIGNDTFNLKQISWTKSKLNWHNEEIPLEIRLTNINNNTGQLTHIIFPVKLIDEKLTESFNNTLTYPVSVQNNGEQNNGEQNNGEQNNGEQLNIEQLIKNFDLNSFFNQIISILSDTKLIDKNLSNIKDVIEKNSDFFKKIKEEASNLINNISLIDPTIKNKFDLNDPDIVSKIVNIKNKLSEDTLKKLDLSNIMNTVGIDLDKFKIILNKINFNEVAKHFDNQQFSTYDINSFMNLNSLLTDKSAVPSYSCCSPNYGKVVSINLCKTAQKVVDQEKFFVTSGNDNSNILITKPQPYNKAIGEQMYKNLGEPSNLYT